MAIDLRLLWFAPLPTAIVAEALNFNGNLRIAAERTKSSDQQFEQLRDGSVDAVVTAIDNVIAWNEWAPEAEFRAIAQVETTTQLSLVARKGINSIADLADARVLVDSPYNGFVIALRALLAGATPAGIADGHELVPAGGVTERLDAMLGGSGDATLLAPPFDKIALDAGCTMLARVNDVWPAFPGQGVVVNLKRMPELAPGLDAWFAAMDQAREWIGDSRQQALSILAQAGVAQENAESMFAAIPADWHPTLAGIDVLIEHRRQIEPTAPALARDDFVDDGFLDRHRAHYSSRNSGA